MKNKTISESLQSTVNNQNIYKSSYKYIILANIHYKSDSH